MTAPPQEPLALSVRLCQCLWRILIVVWSILIAGIVVGIIANLSTTPIEPGTSLRATFEHLVIGRLVLTYPIPIGACGLLLVFLTVASWFGGRRRTMPSSVLSLQGRKHMLQRLRIRYQQSLTQSLQGVVQLELELTSNPAAISNAVSLALHLPNLPDHSLPLHTSIIDAYEQAQQELLILGEPGAGKSTLLLELAHHLVERAEQEHDHLLPVLLPLSTWAIHRPPLQDWIIDQFASIYDISPKVSSRLVKAEFVLPLLDGLDEMEDDARSACISAINAYHRDHLSPLVVCSRTNEYDNAVTSERLALHTAVAIQPLSQAQIDAHLAALGKPATALRAALKKNTVLASLATTPLMLQILILTYRGTSVRHLVHHEAKLRQQIWMEYCQRMVERKGDPTRYPLDHVVIWLHWLARYMRERNLTVFFLEDLRWDILPNTSSTTFHWNVRLIIKLLFMLLVMLSGGLLTGLLVGSLIGPLAGLLTGLFIGLFTGLFSSGHIVQEEVAMERELIEIMIAFWKRWKSKFSSWLLAGLAGLGFGLLSGLLSWLLSWLLNGMQGETMVNGLFFVSVMGLLGGLGLLTGLGTALIAIGEEAVQLAKHQILAPNEGRSSRDTRFLFFFGLGTALLVGLPMGLLVGLLPWLSSMAGEHIENIGWNNILALGLYGGLSFGLPAGLLSGWLDIIRRTILRIFLWRMHLFPWKAVPFLEDATTRILLRHVGGGYSFTHRLLLEYFADLDTSATSTREDDQQASQQPSLETP